METKNSSHTQNNLIMIIAEERHTLRTLYDDIEPDDDGHRYLPPHVFRALRIRSRYNPDLKYYIVNCDAYKRYGYTSDELFDEIYDKYKSGIDVYLECYCKPLRCHGDIIVEKLQRRLVKEKLKEAKYR